MNKINIECSFIEVWFPDQASKALEIEGNVNLTLFIGQSLQKWDIQQNQDLENMLKITFFFFVICKKIWWYIRKKLMDTSTKTGIRTAKATSKIAVQKTTKVIGELIGNKIADKAISIDKPKENEEAKEIEEIYIPPEKRQQIIDELRLFWAQNMALLYKNGISKNCKFFWYTTWW